MEAEEFGQRYLQHEDDITNVLRKQKIYDEDLMHDTYIALYEHSPHPSAEDFVKTFVEFYKNLHKRKDKHESYYEACDNTTMVAHFDRADESDLAYREQIGRRMDSLLRYYVSHPQPGERNHKRSCKILRLYCQGLNECEISDKLKISQSAVCQTIERVIKRLKLIAK